MAWLAACGGVSTTPLDDGGTGSDGGSNSDAATSDGGGGNDGGGNPEAGLSCNAQTVNLTFSGCPAAPTCGGTIVDGVYDYMAGCIADPWAQAKQNCQSLQVSNEQGTVKGCITFAGGTAMRNVQSSYSATLAVPSSCLFNGTCAQLEGALKAYFPTATCAAATTGCTCNVSSSYSGIGAVTYTTTNNQVVTSANNHYDYCVNGMSLGMRWASGPNPEPGIYTLTKQ